MKQLNVTQKTWLGRVTHRFTIRSKIIAGSSFVLIILVVLGVYTSVNLAILGKSVSTVVGDIGLAIQSSFDVTRKLDQIVQEVAFYTIEPEESRVEEISTYFNELNYLVDEMTKQPILQDEPALSRTVEAILKDIRRFRSLYDFLLKLVADDTKNYPGRTIANNGISPINRGNIARSSLMIDSFYEEDEYSSRNTALLQALVAMRDAQNSLGFRITGYLAFRSESARFALMQQFAVASEAIDKVNDYSDLYTLEQEDAYAQIVGSFAKIKTNLDDMIDVHSSEGWRRDFFIINKKIIPLVAQINENLENVVDRIQEIGSNTTDNMIWNIDESRAITYMLVGGGLLFSLLSIWVTLRTIIRPLNRAVLAMEDIGSGSGNLNQRLDDEGKTELARLGGGFNRFVEKIQGVVNLVCISSQTLSTEAGNMAEITAHSKDRVSQQQIEISHVANAIQEMSNTMVNVARDAAAAVDAAKNASVEAGSGSEVVQLAVSAINDLASEVGNVANMIEALATESKNIGEVVSVITAISEQTNLLALNAAIEAARAGEQGRGFAVVADEVRTLSHRIQGETKNIQDRIASLQQGTSQAVETMHKSQEKTANVVELAGKAGTALESITGSVVTINEMNSNIAEATEMQNQRTEIITANMANIHKIAVESSEAVDKASASGNEFRIMSDQLQGLVEQFLLSGSGDGNTDRAQGIVDEYQADGDDSASSKEDNSKVPDDNIELF